MRDAPEEELTIQVTYVNRIHINDMYISESGQREICENLTS